MLALSNALDAFDAAPTQLDPVASQIYLTARMAVACWKQTQGNDEDDNEVDDKVLGSNVGLSILTSRSVAFTDGHESNTARRMHCFHGTSHKSPQTR